MPWNVAHDAAYGIIRVVYEGSVTAEEFKVATMAVIALANEHRTGLILIDDSKLEISVSITDIFKMPKFYEDARASRRTRWALIQPAGGQALKDVKFFETVCRNRGWKVQAFSDRRKAFDWLLSRPVSNGPG